ncbi:transthyretin-like family domain-containing protein [Ditylenchus destructor]|nr:transthyretin-like family domain-containing protein [Ditylenchus destructor]
MLLFVSFIICISCFIPSIEATHKCVWIRGVVRCNRNPAKQLNVEVRVYDRDGLSIFKVLDPDDLMGVTFTEQDGTFQLDGCGDDFNWLPGLQNNPDPYIRIYHYCNSDKGETLELPEFNTFVPETYDMGILELDDPMAGKSGKVQKQEILVEEANNNKKKPSTDPLEKMLENFRTRGDRQRPIKLEESAERQKEKYSITRPDSDRLITVHQPDEIIVKETSEGD